MGGQSSQTLATAIQNLISKQNQLVYLGTITQVREDGTVLVRIKGQEYVVQAISDQPFFAGSQVRVILDDKKGWVLLGTVR